jgi:hypothetical protein
LSGLTRRKKHCARHENRELVLVKDYDEAIQFYTQKLKAQELSPDEFIRSERRADPPLD